MKLRTQHSASLPIMEEMLASSTISPDPQFSDLSPDQVEASEALDTVVRYLAENHDLAMEDQLALRQLRDKLKP